MIMPISPIGKNEYTISFTKIKKELISKYKNLEDTLRFQSVTLLCIESGIPIIKRKNDGYFTLEDAEKLKDYIINTYLGKEMDNRSKTKVGMLDEKGPTNEELSKLEKEKPIS